MNALKELQDVTITALISLVHSGVLVPLDIGLVLTARLVRVGLRNNFIYRSLLA